VLAATAANLYLVLLEPHGWMTYGAVGAWFLAINILALPGTRSPRPLSYIGIAGGIGYWLVVAGTVLRLDALVAIAAAAGVLLAPIWFIWMGFILRRSSRRAETRFHRGGPTTGWSGRRGVVPDCARRHRRGTHSCLRPRSTQHWAYGPA